METSSEGRQAAALDAEMSGVWGAVAVYGAGCLLACTIIGISGDRTSWLAMLIVGAALLGYAGGTALWGKRFGVTGSSRTTESPGSSRFPGLS